MIMESLRLMKKLTYLFSTENINMQIDEYQREKLMEFTFP